MKYIFFKYSLPHAVSTLETIKMGNLLNIYVSVCFDYKSMI